MPTIEELAAIVKTKKALHDKEKGDFDTLNEQLLAKQVAKSEAQLDLEKAVLDLLDAIKLTPGL